MYPLTAYLFRPQVNTLEKVELEKFEDYYKYLNCNTFDVVMPDKDLSLYVDDEGLLKRNICAKIVYEKTGYENVLAGNILFLGGVDEEGETLSVTKTVEEIMEMITEERFTTKG